MLLNYIYNGIIFPLLNPAKIFPIPFPKTTVKKKSGSFANHMRNVNTSNEAKCPLLQEFLIYNFSWIILERVFVGSIVNIRNECLFSWFIRE